METLFKVQFAVWFLVLHLSYYGIAHRIYKVRFILTDITLETSFSSKNAINRKSTAQRLRKIGYLINQLAKASRKLQSIYSIPATMILCASFFSCTISLFIIIQEISRPSSQHSIYLQSLLVVIYTTLALTVIFSVDLPLQEVR